MGFETNYVEAIKRVEDLVEIIFEKLSRNCRYHESETTKENLRELELGECLYRGRKYSQRCEREVCPLLEEEE